MENQGNDNWNPANLVVTEEDRIYHLDLRGDEIGDIIFLVGDPQRVEVVSKYFDRVDVKRNKREFITHTGQLGDKRVSVMSTGISTSNIDIAINELDAVANIDLKNRRLKEKFRRLTFIRLGTSGGINPDVEVDTVIASKYAVGFDALLLMYQKQQGRMPNAVELEKKLNSWFHLRGFSYPIYLSQANDELIQWTGEKYQLGMTATMHGFYAPQSRELRLKSRYPNLMKILQGFEFQDVKFTNIEMESSAIYGLSHLLGHRSISFNCIIANRITGHFSKKPYEAVDIMIKKVMEEVENLP